MEEIIKLDDLKIKDMIFEIRGKQVMLDSDLAKLYQCNNGTKTINQSVKRHVNRFPERYMFQLTNGEFNNLRSQIGTTNFQMIRTLPFVFTEQGVAMLSSVLRTGVAERVSILIMDAFVEMRKYLSSNNIENRISNIETKVIEYDNNFKILFDSFDSKINNYIFFDGEI